jgi:hypothetical protein
LPGTIAPQARKNARQLLQLFQAVSANLSTRTNGILATKRLEQAGQSGYNES